MKVDLSAHHIRAMLKVVNGNPADADPAAVAEVKGILGDTLDRDRRNPMLTAGEMNVLAIAAHSWLELVRGAGVRDMDKDATLVDGGAMLESGLQKLAALQVRQEQRERGV